ncbi:hypothetical protein HNP46_000351 [Pseudomonas nitritireducens]|uniref:Uncharacterized protein n=1 Tax=Pseudomonas nitroreducens TaxID=46680 RepID=A0A7W7KFI6_PSENT|nr:hypothetical protein [Pseudomonas nitritireducens]MBB4861540.1 hypothetical protein [Pseudomonas nitritireducens]
MGMRSLNYIAISPAAKGRAAGLLKSFNSEEIIVNDERGLVICYETNIAPMHFRDTLGEHCTRDLEQEVAVHSILGGLPKAEFRMVRAGEECGQRGCWEHPFADVIEVSNIDRQFSLLGED